MIPSFVKVLALLIGMLSNTPTEVSEYTIVDCPYEHCYEGTNGLENICLFTETNIQQDMSLSEGDKVYVIFLQNEEHRVVRVIKAEQ